jgi:hypothetical protein
MAGEDRLANREALHRVGVHIVARARFEACGRFSLRVTPGGFGTPELGDSSRRVRVAGAMLCVETDRPGAPSLRSTPIAGRSLRQLAAFADVGLDLPLDVGHGTPPLGDVEESIELSAGHVAELMRWYSAAAVALDTVVGLVGDDARPTLPRLWPEHFDVAIEVTAGAERRVNLGASPGDSFCPEPYAYVGPWTPDRPGEPDFWNAPFGAFRPASELIGDPAAELTDFWFQGFSRLR